MLDLSVEAIQQYRERLARTPEDELPLARQELKQFMQDHAEVVYTGCLGPYVAEALAEILEEQGLEMEHLRVLLPYQRYIDGKLVYLGVAAEFHDEMAARSNSLQSLREQTGLVDMIIG